MDTQPVTIPEYALQDKHTFKDWFIDVYARLFEKKVTVKLEESAFPEDDEEAKLLIENIISRVNFLINGDYSMPYRFDASKTRKFTNKNSDVMGIAVAIIMDNYVITSVRLAKLLKLNHSTIVYYKKKIRDILSVNKKYRDTYLRVLLNLQKHELISKVTM